MPRTPKLKLLLAPLPAVLLLCAAPLALGQWRGAPPEPNAPRTASGDVDLEAPPPVHANGRVDLQGSWMPNDNRYIRDLALDIGDDKVPYQPWARRLFDERKDGSHSREDPDAHCLPQGVPKLDFVSYPWKLVETPSSVVMLFETFTFWRQIFTDGRSVDPSAKPAWMGYSTGRWDGDTLVVTTTDIDWPYFQLYGLEGVPQSPEMTIVERFEPSAEAQELAYDIAATDPQTFTQTVTAEGYRTFRWQPGFEFLPQDCVLDPAAND